MADAIGVKPVSARADEPPVCEARVLSGVDGHRCTTHPSYHQIGTSLQPPGFCAVSDGGANVFDSESDVGPCCPDSRTMMASLPVRGDSCWLSHALVGGDQELRSPPVSALAQIRSPLAQAQSHPFSAAVSTECPRKVPSRRGAGRSVIEQSIFKAGHGHGRFQVLRPRA